MTKKKEIKNKVISVRVTEEDYNAWKKGRFKLKAQILKEHEDDNEDFTGELEEEIDEKPYRPVKKKGTAREEKTTQPLKDESDDWFII